MIFILLHYKYTFIVVILQYINARDQIQYDFILYHTQNINVGIPKGTENMMVEVWLLPGLI